MVTKEQKLKIIKEFGKTEKSTGDTSVQIAILTYEINDLSKHFDKNKKDLHSKRGFISKIEKRKKLLAYLKTENFNKYKEVIKKLGLRK